MKKENIVIFCDLCGEEIKNADTYDGTSETNNVGVNSLVYDIWYGGRFKVEDTCRDCNKKIADFLRDNKMIANGQKC